MIETTITEYDAYIASLTNVEIKESDVCNIHTTMHYELGELCAIKTHHTLEGTNKYEIKST
jgi:hypothetical protein